MANEADHQAQEGGAIMATVSDTTMTDTAKGTAARRRRMREIKGVASTPAPGITYEFDETSDISISLQGGTPHTMWSGALHKNCDLSVYGDTKIVERLEGTEGGNSETAYWARLMDEGAPNE